MGFKEHGISDQFGNFEGLRSPEEMQELFNARVLVAGLGAGSPAAIHLARNGVGSEGNGQMIYADPDIVEYRNIGRPPYNLHHAEDSTYKTDALEELVHEINPRIIVKKENQGITPENIVRLVETSDVVIEMIDISKPELTMALHVACEASKKPLVTGMDIGNLAVAYAFDYSREGQMNFQEFLGFPEQVDLNEYANVNPFAIAGQTIIGVQERNFQSNKEAMEFYTMGFFTDPENMAKLFSMIPEASKPMVLSLLNGEAEHIAQTDVGSQTLGVIQSELVNRIILGYSVKTAPEQISIDVDKLISPKL